MKLKVTDWAHTPVDLAASQKLLYSPVVIDANASSMCFL